MLFDVNGVSLTEGQALSPDLCGESAQWLDADINIESLKSKVYAHMTSALNAGQLDVKMASAMVSSSASSVKKPALSDAEEGGKELNCRESLEAKIARLTADLKTAHEQIDALRAENADMRSMQGREAGKASDHVSCAQAAAGSGLRAVRAGHASD